MFDTMIMKNTDLMMKNCIYYKIIYKIKRWLRILNPCNVRNVRNVLQTFCSSLRQGFNNLKEKPFWP